MMSNYLLGARRCSTEVGGNLREPNTKKKQPKQMIQDITDNVGNFVHNVSNTVNKRGMKLTCSQLDQNLKLCNITSSAKTRDV